MKAAKRIFSAFLMLLIIAALVGAAFESAAAQTRKTDKVTVMMGWTIMGKHAPFFVAIEKGWYGDEGIEADIIRGYGGGPAAMAVDQGKATFSLAPIVNIALTRAKGGKIKAVGAYLYNTIAAFASLTETGIKTPKDMEGRTAATSVGSTAVQMLPIFARVNGVDIKKIKIVNVDGSVLVPALLKGEVELSSLFTTALWEVGVWLGKKQGKELSLLAFADWGLEMYSNSIVANDKLLSENPDLVKRFLRATYKGFAYSMDHPAEAISILAKYHPEINKEIARMQLDTVFKMVPIKEAKEKGLGWMSEKKMQNTIDIVSEAYQIKVKLPLEDIYTNKFLPGKF